MPNYDIPEAVREALDNQLIQKLGLFSILIENYRDKNYAEVTRNGFIRGECDATELRCMFGDVRIIAEYLGHDLRTWVGEQESRASTVRLLTGRLGKTHRAALERDGWQFVIEELERILMEVVGPEPETSIAYSGERDPERNRSLS